MNSREDFGSRLTRYARTNCISLSRRSCAPPLGERLRPGASVSAIALSHGINANVIRKWLPMAPKATHVAATLLPVTIRQDSAARTLAPPAIEMSLGGATLRLPPGFDPQDLRSIVQILRTLS